jgi:acetoin utilization protein AcuC
MKSGNTDRSGGIPLYYHPGFSEYDFGPGHPFRGKRFTDFMTAMENDFPEIYSSFSIDTPEPASEEMILRAHRRAYYERLLALEREGGFLTVDTSVLPGSIGAAAMISGASTAAVRSAVENGVSVTFGGLHHAGSDYGGGFCLINDVAVAAMDLLDRGFDRIVILDTDAHQGNGTMDIFYRDPRVLFISIHQDPGTLFPGRGFVDETGSGDGEGFTVNIPVPPLSGIAVFRKAMDEVVYPLIESYNPEIIIRNGGSDPLESDILTNLGLKPDDLRELIGDIHNRAAELGIPIADLFLSGYGPRVTEGWLMIAAGVTGKPARIEIPEQPSGRGADGSYNLMETERTISRLKSLIEPYWGPL